MAQGPIDYLGMMPQQDFLRDIQGGLQLGGQYAQMQQQAKAKELAAARAAQYQQDVQLAMQNPTARTFADLAMKYPENREVFKQTWDTLGEDERKTEGRIMGQAYSAILSGNPNVAKDVLKKQAEALKNSKMDSSSYDTAIKLMDENPQQAQAMLGFVLSNIGDPKEFASRYESLGGEARKAAEAPFDLRKKRAESFVAEGSAESKVQQEAEAVKTAQEKRRIDDLNVQIAQADSETKRGQLVLERDKLMADQGKKDIEVSASTQDAMDSANALMDQIKGVARHPGLAAGTGTLGGIRSFFNSTDANDFRKAVEGLKAPVFLNELAKLKAAGITLGQVTEVEGKKLEQRIANLDTDQSTPSFRNQVGVLLKDTEKFIEKIRAGGKLPTQGGGVVMTHPKFGTIREGDINRMMKANPGSTRAQVLEYLNKKEGGASGNY